MRACVRCLRVGLSVGAARTHSRGQAWAFDLAEQLPAGMPEAAAKSVASMCPLPACAGVRHRFERALAHQGVERALTSTCVAAGVCVESSGSQDASLDQILL